MKTDSKISLLFFAVFIGCQKLPNNTYFFPIEENRLFGLIDFDGNIVVPCKYEYIGKVVDDSVSVVYSNMLYEPKSYYLNIKTQQLTRNVEGAYRAPPLKPIYDTAGKLIFMAKEQLSRKIAGGLSEYCQDFPSTKFKEGFTRTYFVDAKGIIRYQLPDSLSFQGYSEGVYKLYFCSSTTDTCTTIYADTTFKEFFRFQAPMCSGHAFREGFSCIPFYGYINKKGRFIFKSYDTRNDFSEHFAAIYDFRNNRGGYIDTNGKISIAFNFKCVYDFHEGLAGAQDLKTQLYGFIDTTGNWVIPPKYTNLGDCQSCSYMPSKYTYRGFYHGLAMVEIGNKWGYINKQGKVVWWQKD